MYPYISLIFFYYILSRYVYSICAERPALAFNHINIYYESNNKRYNVNKNKSPRRQWYMATSRWRRYVSDVDFTCHKNSPACIVYSWFSRLVGYCWNGENSLTFPGFPDPKIIPWLFQIFQSRETWETCYLTIRRARGNVFRLMSFLCLLLIFDIFL